MVVMCRMDMHTCKQTDFENVAIICIAISNGPYS